MNTLKTGDQVKFLNEVGGGIIRSISGKTAMVETEDGFEVPFLLNFLVKTEKFWAGPGYEEQEIQSEKIVNKEEFRPVSRIEVPFIEKLGEDELIDESSQAGNSKLLIAWKRSQSLKPVFQVWLVNDSQYRMLFSFSRFNEREVLLQGIKAGMLEEETQLLLGEFSEEELKEIFCFKLEALFYSKWKYKERNALLCELRADRRLLADPTSFIPNEYFEENALIQEINESGEKTMKELQDKLIPENLHAKPSDKEIPGIIRSQTDDPEEVDLHIEELIENHQRMTPGEILETQMARFHFMLEGAIQHGVRRIVFIHGVGNGKLRYEIRKALETKYKKLRYQDASFKEYGYGATMVIIK